MSPDFVIVMIKYINTYVNVFVIR